MKLAAQISAKFFSWTVQLKIPRPLPTGQLGWPSETQHSTNVRNKVPTQLDTSYHTHCTHLKLPLHTFQHIKMVCCTHTHTIKRFPVDFYRQLQSVADMTAPLTNNTVYNLMQCRQKVRSHTVRRFVSHIVHVYIVTVHHTV